MNTKSIIEIFRGDDSDALGYQTIVGTIHTDLDLTGCKAVFRYLGFFQEFDPIPEDGKLTIVIPSASSMQFPPGFGYASLKVYDIDRKVRTFTNRIPVFVKTMTPCRGGGEFDVEFSPFPELEPLKIFKGPNADDFDLYTGFISKIIDRASAQKYGLSMLFDAMDAEKTAEGGCAASPAAVKAAYDAIIGVLADNYYTAEQTDEAIDKLAAYYITSDTQGNPFATHAALVNATTYYSGGSVRIPTRNDYAIVVADETHNNEEWRYIYSENEQGVGQWEPQYAVEGVITFDDTVTRTSANGVKSSGIWSALWGALSALPTGFTSLYDWCVSQLAGKQSKITASGVLKGDGAGGVSAATAGTDYQAPLSAQQLANIEAVTNKANDNAVVHRTGNETVGGVKTFDSEGVVVYDSQTGFSLKLLDTGIVVTDGYYTANFYVPNITGGGGTFALISDVTGKADKDESATSGNLAKFDSQGNPIDSQIPAANVAVKADLRYSLGTPTIISSASSEVISGETIYYGEATIADRTANIVQVTAATALDELRITFPAATSGKVRDFGLRVEIGTGSAALAAPALVPIAPTDETIKLENADGTIPALADGTATAKGVTLLYFCETASGVFVVKGEQVKEVA